MSATTPTASNAPNENPLLVRVDAMALAIHLPGPDGVRYRITPAIAVTAATRPVLPVFAGASSRATLVMRLRGQSTAPFEAQLEIAGVRVGTVTSARFDATVGDFEVELTAPLSDVRTSDAPVKLAIAIAPGLRTLTLTHARFVAMAGVGPAMSAFDVREATDSALFDGPERKLFALQNPEEGFWLGTGRWRLRVSARWTQPDGDAASWRLDASPDAVSHTHQIAGDATDVVYENPARRSGGEHTELELALDTSHRDLRGRVPPAGIDLPIALTVEHALRFGSETARFAWTREVALRIRDPLPLLLGFKRLSAVGIDFGTSATVAAFTHRGYRSLMRLGSPPDGANPAENPAYLLIEDHARLWTAMSASSEGSRRFPDIVGAVVASHSAKAQLSQHPNSVVAEIKSLPERVMLLDQAPLLRDRLHQSDVVLDEARVRVLVRTYAYLLGRAINRPGQDVYLQYWLTYPAEFDERARALLEEELRAGILLSVPEGIPASEVLVAMRATEPEAYAAEVCPELATHPAIEPLVAQYGELRFAVFDFGGGTLDIACGRYRPATDAEQAATGCSSVIETLQVGGNDHLGGDYLTHELAWLTHQFEPNLAEMEAKEVPMVRPQTLPENKLARQPQLYKPSLAGRQNRIRFERDLGLEALKFKRANQLARREKYLASRLDGSEVQLESLKADPAPLRERLVAHLEERLQDGARLLASMLASTPWGGKGSWREQGVVILLAGNSSRGEYVESALAKALAMPDLKVWRPDSSLPMTGVVLFETPAHIERGVEIQGITPKTAVALGALKIANREVHLVRAAQGFSYFVGDMKGFPPKFIALIPMGSAPSNPAEWGAHYVDFGTWDAQKPLRVATEYEPARMTSNDPRLLTIATGLPPGLTGRLYICVVAPTRIGLHLALADGEKFVRSEINLAPYLS